MTFLHEQTREDFLRALNALRLELPPSVHDDFCVKSRALVAELEKAEREREDLRSPSYENALSRWIHRAEVAEAHLAKVPALVEALKRIAGAATGVPDWRSMADLADEALAAWEAE